MVLTRRILHDLLYPLGIIIFIYSITHNPITHPKPIPRHGNWSIQLMQHPLIFGIAGHNYLVLRDASGEIEKELHGLATDSLTKQWKYVGTSPTDVLHAWEFDGSRSYVAEKTYSGIIMAEGDADTIKSLWVKGEECVPSINEKDIPYPPFGVNIHGDTENSNSVAYTLSLCMGLNTKHLGLITPGEGRNLLNNR